MTLPHSGKLMHSAFSRQSSLRASGKSDLESSSDFDLHVSQSTAHSWGSWGAPL